MMQFTLADAIGKLYPESEFVIVGDSLEGLTFHTNAPSKMPTESQITTALTQLQNDHDAAIASKTEAKASAVAKLAALGLTSDEIAALLG